MFCLYVKWANQNNLALDKVHHSFGHIVLLVEGENAFSRFKNEIGKHCVQRVPPTEKGSKRHTSMISVSIIKIRESVKWFSEKDVEITAQRGHGAGGQNQNKVCSAIRAIHKQTGISVFINGRDQYRNKMSALEILKERVEDHFESIEKQKESSEIREQRDFGSRSNKVRTYNFIESRIVDHSQNIKKFSDVDKFFKKGDLSIFYQ
jgi:peptide chain release factor 1